MAVPISIATRVSGWLLLAALVLLALSPMGYRAGILAQNAAIDGFALGMAAALLGVIAGLIGAVLALARRSSAFLSPAAYAAMSGILLGGTVWWTVLPGWNAPAIHDVTTSPRDPPRFEALRQPHYAGHPYSSYRQYDEQSGNRVSSAYADLRTLLFDRALHQVFDAALAAARDLGWTIAAAERPLGRIEATDTATIFGFRDDIVIRVRLNESGYVVVDIRSASRASGGDFGRNAARIRDFTRALDNRLPERFREE
jgi:hypothetical protein